QGIADPGGEFVFIGLGPAAEDVAHASTHILERVHAKHALGGDNAEVFGHGATFDPRSSGDEHLGSSLPSPQLDPDRARGLPRPRFPPGACPAYPAPLILAISPSRRHRLIGTRSRHGDIVLC